jgi:hypothetical protein
MRKSDNVDDLMTSSSEESMSEYDESMAEEEKTGMLGYLDT